MLLSNARAECLGLLLRRVDVLGGLAKNHSGAKIAPVIPFEVGARHRWNGLAPIGLFRNTQQDSIRNPLPQQVHSSSNANLFSDRGALEHNGRIDMARLGVVDSQEFAPPVHETKQDDNRSSQ